MSRKTNQSEDRAAEMLSVRPIGAFILTVAGDRVFLSQRSMIWAFMVTQQARIPSP
jgi:hypothetical protein